MAEYLTDFLNKTIKTWQPLSRTPLTLEDARQIAGNMVDLIKLLKTLEEKYGDKKKKN